MKREKFASDRKMEYSDNIKTLIFWKREVL